MTKIQGKMIKWTVLVGVFLILVLSLLSCVPVAEANSEPLMSCIYIGELEKHDDIHRCTMLDTGDVCYVIEAFQGGGISCNFSEEIGR